MDVQLSSAIHTTLGATKRVQAQLERAQESLATGRSSDRVRGNVAAAFVSQSLSSRASDLLSIKSSIGQGASKAETALSGLDTIGKTLDQMKALAIQHQSASSPDEQAALQSQFDVLARQLDNFARDSSFGGTNLISASPNDLTIPLDETGSSSLTIQGQASDSASLGVTITDVASIDLAKQQVSAAAASIGSNASVIDIRERFTDKLVSSLEQGAAKLVQTDLNEEAANAISAQTRGALALAATGLAAQSERAILQLF